MTRAADIHTRLKAEAAASLAKAESEALVAGKEPFNLATFERLLNRGSQREREVGHREAYYISYRNVMTMAEYVAQLHENEPYEDSR